MKVLVTGAAGAIGSTLAERLVREGHEVTALDCFTEYYDVAQKEANADALATAGVTVARIDLAEDDLAPHMRGVEAIFHCAAQPGISASVPFDTYERNNIRATERLLEAARSSDALGHFINIATSSIYGKEANGPETSEPKPASHYGVTKLAAEQLAMALHRDIGFPATSLRLFSVYGERERPDKLYHKLIRAILAGELFPLYEGSREHVRSYTYVGDIVDGFLAVLARRDAVLGEVINIGTDVTHTTGEGIDLVQELMGKEARFDMQPPRPGDQKETAADISKARRLLGYDPRTGLREGLAHEIAWVEAMQR
ncbi:MAG TPA: NAD-dependent epimerase/dehydratase family protein [Candidatus Paceibacterota bacterium]|nr:NAD-dependent epimerase/dehydratase family protein [Candidatus Paceibacterota bacterium]